MKLCSLNVSLAQQTAKAVITPVPHSCFGLIAARGVGETLSN